MVRRLEEELDSANGESRHLSAELVRTTARYKRAQKHNTKTMAEVATLTGDLEEANLTVHRNALRNTDLMSWLDALRHQLDVVATDKEFLHASTQTDPLPSVITSPSLVAGRKSPHPDDDAPDMPPDSPSEGTVFSTPKDGKSAFRRQLKYKRKLGAASVTPSLYADYSRDARQRHTHFLFMDESTSFPVLHHSKEDISPYRDAFGREFWNHVSHEERF